MIIYIDEVEINTKRILLRVDFNVSCNNDGSIKNDERIRKALPTIKMLLDKGNKLFLVTHLGQPKEFDEALTTKRLAERLQELINQPVVFVPFDKTFDPNFYSQASTSSNLFMLDNIRFHAGEKRNDPEFSKQLASLVDVYVDDAFGVCHRPDASVVGVSSILPHYGGLLLKQEVETIRKVILDPKHPVVAIIAGAKVSTKISLIDRFMTLADYVLIGGSMTNNFLKAQDYEIGKGLFEPEYMNEAKRLLELDKDKQKLILPIDQRTGSQTDVDTVPVVKKITDIQIDDETLDIGPETEILYANYIAQAKTIIWNGPLGYYENPQFTKGSLAIYRAIANNLQAISIIGGGDTITVIKKQPDQDKITHISTGGGAMLELMEKGTLPGIEALEK